MTDLWYLDQYRQSKIIACCGRGDWEEAALADILALSQILNEKGIPAWIDIWGLDVTHDWPWWQRMMPYFLSRIGL